MRKRLKSHETIGLGRYMVSDSGVAPEKSRFGRGQRENNGLIKERVEGP